MKQIAFLFFYFLAIPSFSQEEKMNSNQIMLSGAIDSNSAWELSGNYMKRLNSWFGIGAGLNVFKQYSNEISASGSTLQVTNISEWILSDDSKRIAGLQFNPFVHINTPKLFAIEDAEVNIYAEPGLLMTISSNKIEADYWDGTGYYIARTFHGHSGNWLSWNCRLGIALENDAGILCIGYFISNMDMYTYKRNIYVGDTRLGDYMPKQKYNWGIYIGLGMKF